ncbi:polyprotein [Mycena venus]|uniref:Polyprotein n=1 Tax=Mycena venus TaxID=2733690 RepID=A0A8H6Z6T5_9AGAR|nr:polyprotein [Mycena venus]
MKTFHMPSCHHSPTPGTPLFHLFLTTSSKILPNSLLASLRRSPDSVSAPPPKPLDQLPFLPLTRQMPNVTNVGKRVTLPASTRIEIRRIKILLTHIKEERIGTRTGNVGSHLEPMWHRMMTVMKTSCSLPGSPQLRKICPQTTGFLDSGCSRTIVRKKTSFTEYSATAPHKISGIGETAGIGRGTVPLSFALGNSTCACMMRDVLHCPTAPFNLISVARLTDAGFTATFKNHTVELRSPNGTLMAVGDKISRLYKLRIKPQIVMPTHALVARTWDEWHRALGHLNFKSLRHLKSHDMVKGMQVRDEKADMQQCIACIQGKAHVRPFPQEAQRKYENIGDMTYTDLWGKARTRGIRGEHYFISFTDGHGFRSKVAFLKSKEGDEVLDKIKKYVAFVETQTGKKPRRFRFDNGKEYVNQKTLDWLESQGIEWELTAPHSSAQNGVAERLNRTIIERACAMLISAHLPLSCWPEAVAYSFYLKNLSPTRALSTNITPHEAFWKSKPDISNVHEFGSKFWVLRQGISLSKLEPKARQYIFVGVSEHSRAYRYYNPGSRQILTSRNVTFEKPQADSNGHEHFHPAPEPAPLPPTLEGEHENGNCSVGSTPNLAPAPTTFYREPQPLISEATPEPDEEEESENASPPPPSRNPTPTIHVRGKDIPLRAPSSRIAAKAAKDSAHLTFALAAETAAEFDDDPKTLAQARTAPDWQQFHAAMVSEKNQLERLGTWDLVELPAGRKAIASKWVWRRKRDATGKVAKHKARLVADGSRQIPGIDFHETYSPTIRLETFRFLLALAARYQLKVHGIDVVAAYLNGKLEETVYMKQPPDFDDGTGCVCKLKLSIYGLRQSGRNWNQKLDTAFKSLGFTRLIADQCVYIRREPATSSPTIVAVHVDDMTLFAHTNGELTQLKGELASQFNVTDLGPLTQILGMEITRNDSDGSIQLTQANYALRVLESVGMHNCKPVSTPLDHNVKLTALPDGDPRIGDTAFRHTYLSSLGKLMYLAVGTRPDLAYAVQHLSQFSQRPAAEHMSALKHVFRYLRGTYSLGILFRGNGDIKIYCDADWANDIADRRSISGYVSFFGSAPISWSSRKQPTVALSTMEAEYMALAKTTCEVLWLRELASELGLTPDGPTSDNQSAICFAANPVFHARSKHIDIRHHFVRERVASNEVILTHCASEDNLADMLTKALPRPQFVLLRDQVIGAA